MAPAGHHEGSMNTGQTVAIVVSEAFDRTYLHELLVAEGFVVESFAHPQDFIDSIGSASSQGCLIVDLDDSGGDSHQGSLLRFATRWSRELPTIAIASDPSIHPPDPLLPTISKAAGESHLLYLLYGALSEPTGTTTPRSEPGARC